MSAPAMRPELPPLPERMRDLPISPRGYPVPYFVAWVNGEPDFRVMDGEKLQHAVRFRRCWLCGDALGRIATFVIGPMCAINRTSAEPPSHRECAEYAVRACPFLMRPDARRRESNVPQGAQEPAGDMIRRNPGVSLLWVSRSFRPWSPRGGGVLFDIGEPVETAWLFQGRAATREEVLASFDSGCPELRDTAEKHGELAAYEAAKARALTLAPP